MKNYKVSIIGCGNIGLSLLQGLLKDKQYPAKEYNCNQKKYSGVVPPEVKPGEANN